MALIVHGYTNYAEAYNNRAPLQDGQGAIADLSRAIELNSNYAEAYNNRGIAHAHLQDYQRAIADLSRAIELNPEFKQAYLARANVWVELAEPDKAEEDRLLANGCLLSSQKPTLPWPR